MKKKSIAARLGVLALALTMITTSLSSGTLAKFAYGETYNAVFTVARWNVMSRLVQYADGTTATQLEKDATLDVVDLAASTTVKKNTVVGKASGDDTTPSALAPGMAGTFYIELTNAFDTDDNFTSGDVTDVAVDYWVYIQPSTKVSAPQYFTMTAETANITGNFDGTNKKSLNNLTQVTADDSTTGNTKAEGHLLASGYIPAGGTSATDKLKKVKVDWEWPYQSYDASVENNNAEAASKADDTDKALAKLTNNTTQTGATRTAKRNVFFDITVIMVQHDPNTVLSNTPTRPTIKAN